MVGSEPSDYVFVVLQQRRVCSEIYKYEATFYASLW